MSINAISCPQFDDFHVMFGSFGFHFRPIDIHEDSWAMQGMHPTTPAWSAPLSLDPLAKWKLGQTVQGKVSNVGEGDEVVWSVLRVHNYSDLFWKHIREDALYSWHFPRILKHRFCPVVHILQGSLLDIGGWKCCRQWHGQNVATKALHRHCRLPTDINWPNADTTGKLHCSKFIKFVLPLRNLWNILEYIGILQAYCKRIASGALCFASCPEVGCRLTEFGEDTLTPWFCDKTAVSHATRNKMKQHETNRHKDII